MTFIEHRHPNGVVYQTAPVISTRHGFSTRYGGVSRDYLRGLNLGEHRGDEPANVTENYKRFAEALGFDMDRMVFPHQVHGSAVRTVTAADIHTLHTPVPYDADGLVTAERDLTLICFTADCVPTLLCDAQAGVIAAVHCGWRSSVADILGRALAAMQALGARPERISAAIGPAIGRCCFEVGPEVTEAAARWLGEALGDLALARGDRFLLDLRGANARRLRQLGLDPANIAVSSECTMCAPEKFWSHRVVGEHRGSMAAAITLPGD
ncbi:MAG: peptidoglycan editing factor PgeF [Oscillospiraceae bacterium]|nr:peptidoglycan editing factor PgeF [Oscillospiraceae bacterium]